MVTAVLCLLVVYVVWGSTYYGIRLALETMPALLSAGVRFLASGLLIGVCGLVMGGWRSLRMNRAQFVTAAAGGVLLPAFGNGFVTIAEQQLSSGVTALIVASVPLYVAVNRFVLGDRPSRMTGLGVLIGFGGLAVLLIAGNGAGSAGTHGSAWWGPWLVLLASAGWSVGTVMTSRRPVPPSPFALTMVQMLVGGAILTVLGAGVGERVDVSTISASSLWAWVYLVVAGGAAMVAFAVALRGLPVSTVATYAYVNPIIAVLLGVLLGGESMRSIQLVGGVIVIIAVVLVVRAERPRKPATPDPLPPA